VQTKSAPHSFEWSGNHTALVTPGDFSWRMSHSCGRSMQEFGEVHISTLALALPCSRQKNPFATTPCSLGGTPVVMLACTVQVTAGNPAASSARSPPAVSALSRGMASTSAPRRPGTERRMTYSGMAVVNGRDNRMGRIYRRRAETPWW
jgi:hypothetical protein